MCVYVCACMRMCVRAYSEHNVKCMGACVCVHIHVHVFECVYGSLPAKVYVHAIRVCTYIFTARTCTYSETCIIQHPLGNVKQCWINRLLDYSLYGKLTVGA